MNIPVSWQQDVIPKFAPLHCNYKPWRWHRHNESLGEWLLEIRRSLDHGDPIDLRDAPIEWVPTPKYPAQHITVVRRVLGNVLPRNGTVVALGRFRRDCAKFAEFSQGTALLQEELEGKEMLKFADRLENSSGPETAVAVIEFAKQCAVGVSQLFPKSKIDQLKQGRLISTRNPETQPLFEHVNKLLDNPSSENVWAALFHISMVPNVQLYCREAYSEVTSALRFHQRDSSLSLRSALVAQRDNLRHSGRRGEKCIVSRPLLAKGLQFDHAVVIDADSYNKFELYVALTRARKSLTIISTSKVICPLV